MIPGKIALLKAGKLIGKISPTQLVEMLSHALTPAGAAIGRAVDDYVDGRKQLVGFGDVLDIDVNSAKQYLEQLGFSVHLVAAKPHKKLANRQPGTVVGLSPKKRQLKPGSLVKLYYVDEAIIHDSNYLVELPDVTGLPLEEAIRLLQDAGLKPIAGLAPAKKKYLSAPVDTVLAMKPAPSLIARQLKRDSLIKLYYLSAEHQAQMREMITAKTGPAKPKKIARGLSRAKKALPLDKVKSGLKQVIKRKTK